MDSRRWGFCFALVFALLAMTSLPCPAGQQRVLLVQSYDRSLPWSTQCERGIRSTLPESVVLDVVYLDTKHLPPEEYLLKAEAALDRFRRTRPDLVMLGDDNALRLLGPKVAETGVPVVYFGINNNPRAYFDTLPSNVVGTIERISLFHWVRWLTRVVPDAERILVLMDDSPTSRAIRDSSFKGRDSVDFDDKSIRCVIADDWSRWREWVLGADCDLIVTPHYHALRDEAGNHVNYDTVINWTSRNSPVPIFTAQEYSVGDEGAVGALVVVGEEHGRIAGEMARRILAGEDIALLSTGDDQLGQLFFNRKQLRRFNLTIPPDLAEKAIFK